MLPVIIEVLSNVQGCLTGLDYREQEIVYQALSVEVPHAEYSAQYKLHQWDGRRRFFSKRTGRFPLGLLPEVRRALKRAKVFQYRVLDRRERLAPEPAVERISADMLHGLELRDYQLDAVETFLEERRGILWAATNAGKFPVAAAVIKVLPYETRILYLVHKKVLLRQAHHELAFHLGLLPEHIGVIGGGHGFKPKRITVATVQSVFRLLKHPRAKLWFWNVDLLVMDECHHGRSTTHYTVAKAVDAPYRLGLSGTPFTSVDSELLVKACTGPVLSRVTNKELIARGISARPTVEIISFWAQPLEASAWEWLQIYREGIVESPERNAAIIECIQELVDTRYMIRHPLRVCGGQGRRRIRYTSKGLQILVLVTQIWHGEILATLLRAQRIPYRFVHGQMPLSEINAAQVGFEERKFPVLIASPIFDEGLNLMGVEALIIADAGKSLRKLLQQVGRALRRKLRGPNVVRIIDFDDRHHSMLAGHSLERLAIYEGEGFEIVRTRRGDAGQIDQTDRSPLYRGLLRSAGEVEETSVRASD